MGSLMVYPFKELYRTTIDDTAIIASIDMNSYEKRVLLELTGKDSHQRASALHSFMARYLTNEGHEVRSSQNSRAEPTSRLIFSPRDNQFRDSVNPMAAAQDIIGRITEMESMLATQKAYRSPMSFEDALEQLDDRYPDAVKEVVPSIAQITERTRNNVPFSQVKKAIVDAVLACKLDDKLPKGTEQLKTVIDYTVNAASLVGDRKPVGISGRAAPVSDHRLRGAVRRGLSTALEKLGVEEPAPVVEAAMKQFIRIMHEQKREYPPFASR